MTEQLFTVQSTFRIQGRGLALIGITAEQYGSVQRGDTVVIECPDGSAARNVVLGVEYPPSVIWVGERSANPRYGVIVDADDVPVGSVITVER
jgi:hypothetical protein